MKMITALLLIGSVSLCHADFITLFPVSASNDFQHAQIGTHGRNGTETHNNIEWNTGYVRLDSRYFQPVSRILISGDNGSGLDDGVFSLANDDIQVRLSYDYYAGDSDSALAEVALNMPNNSGNNNYPVYFARVSTNALQLYRQSDFSVIDMVAMSTLDTTASGNNMELILTATDAGGDAVDLSVHLLQNGSVISSTTYNDADGYQSGYAGFAGGDARSTGTFYGIDATEFYVGTPLAIPEPSALVLLGLGTVLLTGYRRRRTHPTARHKRP